MEQTTLNQKSWYRALKVLFVLAFLLSQAFGFLITYGTTSEKVSFVKCDNGKEFKNDYDFNPTDSVYLDFFKQCDPEMYYFNNSSVKGNITSTQHKKLADIISQMQVQGTILASDFQTAVDNFKAKYANNLTPNLTEQQFQENITALQQQGAPPQDVQDYKNNYTKNINGIYVLKGFTPAEFDKMIGFHALIKVTDNNSWVANFTLIDKDKNSLATKAFYYILSFFIVSVIFWLISRTFFYIFAKEKFLKFPVK